MAHHNKELKLKHLFDGGAWNVYESATLNLGVGAPGTDLLESCCDIFKKATEHCLAREKNDNQSLIFQYGPPNGSYEVRHEIAQYFSNMYKEPVNSEDLIITTGATQGLHIVLTTLVDLDGYIFVDEFTYMIALESMKHFTGLKIVPLKLNDDGVDLIDLESKMATHRFKSKTKEFWAIYFTIPTYHNPTGILFSPAVCRGIVKMARKYDFLVLCDDVYNILHYGERPEHSRLFYYDTRTDSDFVGNVISNGSFSKIIGPGVRLGYLEVPARLKPHLEKSGIICSGGCLNNYTAAIVGCLFELNLAQRQIVCCHETYKERMLAVVEVLSDKLPKGCRFLVPSGGYFIWVCLPENLDANEFLKYSMKHEKIFFIVGTQFAIEKERGNHSFRISIAFHDKNKLVDGIKRLCSALENFMIQF